MTNWLADVCRRMKVDDGAKQRFGYIHICLFGEASCCFTLPGPAVLLILPQTFWAVWKSNFIVFALELSTVLESYITGNSHREVQWKEKRMQIAPVSHVHMLSSFHAFFELAATCLCMWHFLSPCSAFCVGGVEISRFEQRCRWVRPLMKSCTLHARVKVCDLSEIEHRCVHL